MLLVLLLFSSFMAEVHTIRAKEGEEFTIELASNPTTGYMWKYLEPEGGILNLPRKLSDQFLPSHPPTEGGPMIAGAGGIQKFTFKAEKKGTHDLQFARPWEKNKNPTPETYRVIVE